jgi:hypothetical protein
MAKMGQFTMAADKVGARGCSRDLLALVSSVALIWFKVNTTWLVAGQP